MVRKLLMLVAVGILLTPTIFHAAQAQDRGGEEEPPYLSIPAPSGQVSEVIPATRPLREIAFPLLPEPESACMPSSGPREVRLQLFNPGSLEARVETRGLASDGRELEVVSLPALLPQEHRTIDIADVFRSASATLPASVRLSSDQPLVGLQWRSTESDLAALPGLQTARKWQVPPARRLTGAVTASLWLFNPGDDNTTVSIEDAVHGTAVSVSLRPGELREVAATGWIHDGIRVLSGDPVAAYMLYRSATGCGWATASAEPGLTRAMQPIEIEVSADGSRIVAWPSAAVTDETLSFRHPVDQVSVSAECGLGGVCALRDEFNRHTAVDYGTANTNPPAFASNFGTLRRVTI